MKRKLSCRGHCHHTDAEHKAFNEGVDAGEKGREPTVNPYTDDALREAWFSGQSVGSFYWRGKQK